MNILTHLVSILPQPHFTFKQTQSLNCLNNALPHTPCLQTASTMHILTNPATTCLNNTIPFHTPSLHTASTILHLLTHPSSVQPLPQTSLHTQPPYTPSTIHLLTHPASSLTQPYTSLQTQPPYCLSRTLPYTQPPYSLSHTIPFSHIQPQTA
jgi:hypothetical protein